MGYQIHFTADLEGIDGSGPVGYQTVCIVFVPYAVAVGIVGYHRTEFSQLIHGPAAASGQLVQVFNTVIQRNLLVEQEAEHIVPQRQGVIPGEKEQLAVYSQRFGHSFAPPGLGQINVGNFMPVQQNVLGHDFRYCGSVSGDQVVSAVTGHYGIFQILVPGLGGRTPFAGGSHITHGDVVFFHDLGIPGIQCVVHRLPGHIFRHELHIVVLTGQQMEITAAEILVRQVVFDLRSCGFSGIRSGLSTGSTGGFSRIRFGFRTAAGCQGRGRKDRRQQHSQHFLCFHEYISPFGI